MIQFRVTELPDTPEKTSVELIDPISGAVLDQQIFPLSWRSTVGFSVNFYGWRAEILPSQNGEAVPSEPASTS